MAVCKKCGCETEDVYSYVTVRTMTVRDLKGAKHYEAMGDIVDAPLCDKCIEDCIQSSKTVRGRLFSVAKLPLAMAALGVAAQFLGLGGAGWVIGAVLLAFGAAIFLTELRKLVVSAKEAAAAPDYANRKKALGALAAQVLPKKHNDADLKYIPLLRLMNESTEALSKDFHVSRKKLASIKSYVVSGKAEDAEAE